jgi:UDP-N-acetylglucosamine 2-epimerase
MDAALKDIEAPGWAIIFGDRKDALEAALDLHYQGIRLVHVGGGDTPHGTGGHPDHRTRDAISMLARVHCVANGYARNNLARLGQMLIGRIRITGSPGLDEVVAYAATLDPDRERSGVFEWLPEVECLTPGKWEPSIFAKRLDPKEFLHAIAHAELFRTNSSTGMYEAPILQTPVEFVGDRQKGRQGPYHDPEGRACEKIRKVVEDVCIRGS